MMPRSWKEMLREGDDATELLAQGRKEVVAQPLSADCVAARRCQLHAPVEIWRRRDARFMSRELRGCRGMSRCTGEDAEGERSRRECQEDLIRGRCSVLAQGRERDGREI